jgi:uncharacterized protein YdhG (YjbR/CyaY superfamily)
MAKVKPTTIAQYIKLKPKEAQPHLKALYAILKSVAPNAKEVIKWGNPVWEENRILFALSAFKSHVNFMPTQASLLPFAKELEKYKTGKDTIQLRYDQPIPKTLIKKIASHRAKDVRENDSHWM